MFGWGKKKERTLQDVFTQAAIEAGINISKQNENLKEVYNSLVKTKENLEQQKKELEQQNKALKEDLVEKCIETGDVIYTPDERLVLPIITTPNNLSVKMIYENQGENKNSTVRTVYLKNPNETLFVHIEYEVCQQDCNARCRNPKYTFYINVKDERIQATITEQSILYKKLETTLATAITQFYHYMQAEVYEKVKVNVDNLANFNFKKSKTSKKKGK